MDQYVRMEDLGDGSSGSVYKAFSLKSHEIVAVKKMKRKFFSWDECMDLREVKCLQNLNHPNIVECKDVVLENDEFFIILEFLENNLFQLMKDQEQPFSEGRIRVFLTQILLALSHMHGRGYFHRDLKPENLLVTKQIIKIGDFGLGRDISSNPPYTDYVSTRWYRAPEVMLQFSSYSPAIDMWAVGTILAEMLTLSPLFPGESEIDQLYKISRTLGSPDFFTWPDGCRVWQMYNLPTFQGGPTNLSALIPHASPLAIDLIAKLCSWDPQRRPTAEEALQHPFFMAEWVAFPLRDISYHPPDQASHPTHHQSSTDVEKPALEMELNAVRDQTDDCFLGLTLGRTPSNSCHDINSWTPFQFISYLPRDWVDQGQPSPDPLLKTQETSFTANAPEGSHQNSHQTQQGQENKPYPWIPLWSVYGG